LWQGPKKVKGPFVAVVEIGGPFKVETKPHTIAAKIIPPEEVPTAAAEKMNRIKIAVGLAVVITVIVIAGLAKRKKTAQAGEGSED
jgi:hypothetical protein